MTNRHSKGGPPRRLRRAQRPGPRRLPIMSDEPSATAPKAARVRIENVNHPGSSTSVDAGLYEAMREALLAVLPEVAPGLTEAQMRTAVVAHLPEDLYPGGARSGWWAKAVQLDLEAKGVIVRETTRPLRWHHPGTQTPVAHPTPAHANPERVPGGALGRTRTRNTFSK
jgi:hypothetical protein